MTPQDSGDMIEAGAFSVEELREAVFEGRGRVARPLALALLSRKDYPDKVADLRTVLVDETEQPRLRALAASALGEVVTPASVRALERGLQSRENVTLRAVTKALANVGGRKHVKRLEELAEAPGPLGTDARRALTVLTERLKLERPGAPTDLETMPVQATGKPTAIRTRAASAGDVAKVIRALPTRELARRGAVSFQCQGRQLLFAFDEASLDRGLDMLDRGGEVGIVAEPPGVEGVEWSPRYSVSVEPEGEGAFRIVVTTPAGRPVFTGRGRREGREATFELAAVDAPGALPVEIRGRFDGQKLKFDRARSGVRRRPSRTPSAEGRAER